MFQKWWKRNGTGDPSSQEEGLSREPRSFDGRSRGDHELFSVQFPVENKMFYVDLKQNSAGTYLKISEKSGGRRHNVLIPVAGLPQLREALEQAMSVAGEHRKEESSNS
jgi:hypothetical protein